MYVINTDTVSRYELGISTLPGVNAVASNVSAFLLLVSQATNCSAAVAYAQTAAPCCSQQTKHNRVAMGPQIHKPSASQ
jgi:hypothetical protein